MTLSTATLDRFATITSARPPITEVALSRNPTNAESGTRTQHLIYVTDVEEHPSAENLIGTTVQAIPSPSQNGWLYRNLEDATILRRVYGAVLNDEMVNGRYYRSLDNHGMLVRYNDDDHAGDRHLSLMPLSILAVHGAPWPIPNDGMLSWTDVPYIEVQAPVALSAPPVPVEVGAPIPAELPDAQQFVADTTLYGPTRGLAEVDGDGRVRLNPEPEVGQLYLEWAHGPAWSDSRNTAVKLCTGIGDDGPEFHRLGYYRLRGTDPVYVSDDSAGLLAGEMHTAKLALTSAPVTREDASAWAATRSLELGRFQSFNEAVNELAKDNDWCSEYEGIIEPLGMEGRAPDLEDYDVEISVDFEFTDDSPTGSVDTFVGDHYDIPGISLSNATYSGTATITVYAGEHSDSDSASESLDEDQVREELRSAMSYAGSIDVTDWEVRGTSIR